MNTATLLAGIPEASPVGSLWRHRGGGTYRVVGHGLIEATLTAAVIYEPVGFDGPNWVRPADEFLDGRFTRVENDGEHRR